MILDIKEAFDILAETKNPLYALIVAIGGVVADTFKGIYSIFDTVINYGVEVFNILPEEIRNILIIFLTFPVLLVTIKMIILIKEAVYK